MGGRVWVRKRGTRLVVVFENGYGMWRKARSFYGEEEAPVGAV
jgi:hypothetical protein